MKLITILTVIIASMLVANSADAQVCNIKGTYDTIEVAYDSYDAGTNTLSISVNSDSPFAANITATVSVTYKCNNNNQTKKETYSGKFIANPSTSTKFDLTGVPSTIKEGYSTYTLSNYSISLSGNKCE